MQPQTEPRRDTAWQRFLHRRGLTRGDLAITGGGLCLAFACAVFPWYVFFNQEQFGVREMRFSGNMTPGRPDTQVIQPPLVMAPMDPADVPLMELDLLATGTPGEDKNRAPVFDQPFPTEIPVYRLVHVANGRAMIEDDGGLFVVQPGSPLPDATTVASIEERDGKWVMVNSSGTVFEVK